MKDRPIIFSAPMVRALLDGSKTQTRRIIKGVRNDNHIVLRKPTARKVGMSTHVIHAGVTGRLGYEIDGRLWVRESHALVPSSAYRMSSGVPYAVNVDEGSQACVYREGWERSKPGTGWRPSIHMPRWASRLTLVITSVKVERLQDISEEDAKAEGVGIEETVTLDCGDIPGVRSVSTGIMCSDHRDAMRETWSKIHGPGAWDANPWVCAISFTVHRQNIDAMKEGDQ